MRIDARRFAATALSQEPSVTPIRIVLGRRADRAPYARPSAPPPRRSASSAPARPPREKCRRSARPLRSHGTLSGARHYTYTHRPWQTGSSGAMPTPQRAAAPPEKCHPLEGPLSTPDTSPCPSPPGVAWFRTFVLGQYLLVAFVARPSSRVLGAEIPHQPPIGIKVLEPGTGSSTPGTLCPQKIFGSRSCPRLEDSRSELPRRTGRQHVVARDLGASPAKSNTAGGRGSISQ